MLLMGSPEKSKKIATVIIGKMRGDEKNPDERDEYSPMKEEEEEETMDTGSAMKASARAIISAVKDGDEGKLVDAMQAFFEQCYANHEDSEETSEESSSDREAEY